MGMAVKEFWQEAQLPQRNSASATRLSRLTRCKNVSMPDELKGYEVGGLPFGLIGKNSVYLHALLASLETTADRSRMSNRVEDIVVGEMELVVWVWCCFCISHILQYFDPRVVSCDVKLRHLCSMFALSPPYAAAAAADDDDGGDDLCYLLFTRWRYPEVLGSESSAFAQSQCQLL